MNTTSPLTSFSYFTLLQNSRSDARHFVKKEMPLLNFENLLIAPNFVNPKSQAILSPLATRETNCKCFWTPSSEGGSCEFSFVRESVSPSVTSFSKDISLNCGKCCISGPKLNSYSVHYIFLKFYSMKGMKKFGKVTVLVFQEKFL